MMENYKHTTVLLDEAVNGLNIRPDGIYIDGTFGRGGHSRLILSQLGEEGRLQALSAQRVRGPAWACLVHRDSQDDPLARQFLDWLRAALLPD